MLLVENFVLDEFKSLIEEAMHNGIRDNNVSLFLILFRFTKLRMRFKFQFYT